jgi:prepilin-type N-terminal cleavage/methylation domain-containing protein
MRKRSQHGFTLIEALIVVSVILILAGLAIIGLVSSRQRANEASAVGAIRSVLTACTSYQTSYQTYPISLAQLGSDISSCTPSSTTACLIDEVLASGTKSSYRLTFAGDGQTFTIVASPISTYAGVNEYCSDASDIVRIDKPGACTQASPAL